MIYKKEDAKKYIVNICHNVRTLHMNETNCCHIEHLREYQSFETEKEALVEFNGNYKKCKICFKEERIS